MKNVKRKNFFLFCVLLITILLMSIGYASINSVTGEITGNLSAEMQDDVFIANVEYVSDVDANLSDCEIERYSGTLLQSKINLSSTNANSEVKYKITLYNNSKNTYTFLASLFDENFYDNENIEFEISDFKIGDTINAGETKEIYITFKYKDNISIPQNTELNSYINLKIGEPNRLVLAKSVAETGNYLESTIAKKAKEKKSK